jgi:hypothetical protein
MFDEYEIYQGLVLRHLVTEASSPITARSFVTHGRISSFVLNERVGVFVLNERVGVFVKHSSKRMRPWRFTFHIDQIADMLDLEAAFPNSFATFVCGTDGLLTLDMMTLHQLVSFEETEQAWVRIDRRPRAMYSLSGNRSELSHKVARGAETLLSALHASERSVAA